MPYLPTVYRTVKQRFPHFNSVLLLPYNTALLPPPLLLDSFTHSRRWNARQRESGTLTVLTGFADGRSKHRCQALEYSVLHRTVVILMRSEVLFWQLSHNLHRRHMVIKIPTSGCAAMADNRPGLAGKTWSNDSAALFARAWRERRTVLVSAACCEGGVCDNTTCFLWLYRQK